MLYYFTQKSSDGERKRHNDVWPCNGISELGKLNFCKEKSKFRNAYAAELQVVLEKKEVNFKYFR